MLKFKVGDIVRSKPDSKGFYVFADRYPPGTLFEITRLLRESYIGEPVIGGFEQFFDDDDVNLVNDPRTSGAPKLILQGAVFTDQFGNEYKVNRSPCRHYFLKVNEEDQVRTSIEEVRHAVEGL